LSTLTIQQISFFVILLAAFTLLITEWIRTDLVAALIILALAITGVLSPAEALSGFGSEPAIIVVSIFVLSGAFYQTGLADSIGQRIGRLAGHTYPRLIAVLMPTTALLSAFTHHVTTTAVLLPVTLSLAQERSIPPSKLLIPLAFAASLGTTVTIIGAPAFLIASATLQQAGYSGLGIFAIAPIGLSLSLVGTLFMLLAGRFLLPDRAPTADLSCEFHLDHYFTELTILPQSPLLGKTLAEIKADARYHFTVVGWIRNDQRLPGPHGLLRVQVGDVLLVNATPEDIMTLHKERGIALHPVTQYASSRGSELRREDDPTEQWVQAVVAPRADLIGRTLRDLDFRRRYGAIVVGLWRHSAFLHEELAEIRLQPSDVLVLQGDAEALVRVGRDPAFLMLVPFHGEARLRRKAPLTAMIMLATIGVAAFNLLSLEIATLAGAVAVVLSGCLTPRQAYRAIDARIYLFIAGAIPLGAAMQTSGAADVLAGWLQNGVAGWGQFLILLAIFAGVGVMTQFMSDAATTALFAPVAVALAHTLGHRPEPYVVTVAMAAVTAFLTPIGHHGNLLVYGPGGYRFGDFVRVGTPLTILVGLVVTMWAQVLWPG
jgi:di/tricarboxylate transporter